MSKRETPIHSFTIRLWLEEANSLPEKSWWRGHITHIPSKTRRYFEDLDDIKPFIRSYLSEADNNKTM
jgi:hypothetical protein